MRIIEPGFELLFTEQLNDITKRLERIARTCYKSEDRISEGSDLKLIQTLLSRKHFPMFDHVSISVRVICDRGVTHEIVRHRIAAYAQESTRFCNYSKARFGNHLTFIKPCFFPDIPCGEFDGPKDFEERLSPAEVNWLAAISESEHRYINLLNLGCKPEEARSVLPNSLKTEIVMTLDLTAWHHFFELRTGKAAHPQMREIAIPMLEEFKANVPLVFDDIEVT
jgi:thymidylate synthase (FAD)